MDQHLRTYARKRREDAGQPELHPATRRVLQSEVAKLRPQAGARDGSIGELLSLRWPRLAFAAALFIALGVGIWSLLPDPNRASGPGLMAKRFAESVEATATFNAKPPGRLEKAAADGTLPPAERKTADEPALDLGPQQDKPSALRSLAESTTRKETDPLGLAESKSDFDAFGGEALALGSRRVGSPGSKLATDAGGNTPNLSSAGVAERPAVVFNDSVSYSRAPAAGEQRLTFAAGTGGAAGGGTERLSFLANNPTNARSEGLGWRSDGFSVSPAGGGNRGNGLSAAAASTSQITNGISLGAMKPSASRESVARIQAPVSPAAAATPPPAPSGTIGDLALNRPRTAAPPARPAPAPEGQARLESELLKAKPSPASGPERFFKESNPAPINGERGFLLAAGTQPRPLSVDALAPSANPAPIAPSTPPAPAVFRGRAATAGRQPAPAPGPRSGGNNLGVPPRSESNAASGYRFARLSVADESLADSRNSLARTAPSVLERFDFEQNAAGVRLIDGDGSIYEGRLFAEAAMPGGNLAAIRDRGQIPAQAKDSLKLADAGKTLEQSGSQFAWAARAATNATFHVTGTNRTSGLLVTFTGSLVSGVAPAEAQRKLAVAPDQTQRFRGGGAPLVDAGAASRLVGRLRIGTTNETDFFAAPVAR